MSINIRPEFPFDATAIDAVTVAAFRNAPHSSHTEQLIVAELRRTGGLSVSLVAEDTGEIVGHVAVSPVEISDGALRWHGLGPISVVPARQGKGIGSQLMAHALAELRRLGAAGCVVLGEPRFYGRFGFRPVPSLVLQGVPPEYFQAVAFGAAMPAGTVTYHAAFNIQG